MAALLISSPPIILAISLIFSSLLSRGVMDVLVRFFIISFYHLESDLYTKFQHILKLYCGPKASVFFSNFALIWGKISFEKRKIWKNLAAVYLGWKITERDLQGEHIDCDIGCELYLIFHILRLGSDKVKLSLQKL